jgi:hypothetical protein
VEVAELRKRNEKGEVTNQIEGYALSQSLAVSCRNVTNIATAATRAADLLGEGIQLHAGRPMYYFTGVSDLKPSLLEAATADARARAKTLAEGSGVRLGPLRAARQGVFSVRAADETGISEYSTEDTNSIEKKVSAIVTVDYAMR